MDARQKSRFEGSRVLTGNRLKDGRVVWYTPAHGWSERIGEALVMPPGSVPGLVEAARADVERRIVVDVYEVDLRGGEASPVPVTERERIRAFGPSTHPAFAPG